MTTPTEVAPEVTPGAHPLDPLSATEISQVTSILRRDRAWTRRGVMRRSSCARSSGEKATK